MKCTVLAERWKLRCFFNSLKRVLPHPPLLSLLFFFNPCSTKFLVFQRQFFGAFIYLLLYFSLVENAVISLWKREGGEGVTSCPEPLRAYGRGNASRERSDATGSWQQRFSNEDDGRPFEPRGRGAERATEVS